MKITASQSLRRIAPALLMAMVALILILFSSWLSVDPVRAKETQTPSPLTEKFLANVDPNCERLGRCEVGSKMVFAALQVNSLDSSLDAPNKYIIHGWFNLNWLPSAYPNWDPNDLSLGCRTRSSGCKFSGWQSTFNADSGQRRIWGANFELVIEERDTFFAYPFDQHWIKIVIQPNELISDQFIKNIDIDSFKVQLSSNLLNPQNGSFDINYATIGRKDNSSLISAVMPNQPTLKFAGSGQENDRHSLPTNSGISSSKKEVADEAELQDNRNNDYLTTSVSFHLVRRTPAALLMIVTPLLLILLTTIIGFHWRESSPASRFGASGLLAAVSLYFASRVFRPAVDYLVFSDIWFLLDYVAITANSILLVWLFRFYKHRSEVKRGGETLAPLSKVENRLTMLNALALIAVLAILFVISRKMLQPPSIPVGFLTGNSNSEDFGTSIVKVIERHELLPSFYLLQISPD
jgi:hypothetical protein